MKKIVIASDSFKGSLTSREVAEAAAGAVRDVFPRCEVVCLPVADGGEGTLDALCDGLGGERVNIAVQGPSGRVVQAEYGIVKEGNAPLAIIEMARASGLPLVPPEERNPMNTSSFGTGELITDRKEYQLYDKNYDADGDGNRDFFRTNVMWGVGAGFRYKRYFLRGGYDFGITNPYRDRYFDISTGNQWRRKGRFDQWSIKLGIYLWQF